MKIQNKYYLITIKDNPLTSLLYTKWILGHGEWYCFEEAKWDNSVIVPKDLTSSETVKEELCKLSMVYQTNINLISVEEIDLDRVNNLIALNEL